MLTVSLHGIKLSAPIGLFPQELIIQNNFIVDVDIVLPTEPEKDLPFADYGIINEAVQIVFNQGGQLLETLALEIHKLLSIKFLQALKIRVSIKKLHPPLPGMQDYAMVVYEP
jgi:7,8-dihydroneopterin aldolase/epimerase/oxygenase